MALTVSEVSMAAPDIICALVFDDAVRRGNLVNMGTPQTGTYDVWTTITNPLGNGNNDCLVVSPDKSWLRFADRAPVETLDMSAADTVANYSTSVLGGRTITEVHRVSFASDQGHRVSSLATISLRHWIYLKLSSALTAGSYTLKGVGVFSDKAFTYDDKVTRACCIRATMLGHRPGDAGKVAYLSQKILGYGTEGAVNFASDYSITQFHIISSGGTIVFTGSVVERVTPTQAEDIAPGNYLNIKYASSTTPPLNITAVTRQNPCQMTYSNTTPAWLAHGVEIIPFGIGVAGAGTFGDLQGLVCTVANLNTGAKTFTIGVDTSAYPLAYANGVFQPGYDSLVYKVWVANTAATYVYILDYSSWVPGSSGTHYVYIAGIGVSDAFTVSEDAYFTGGATVALGGLFNNRYGMALSGEFGYTKPVSLKDGVGGITILKSLAPASWNEEGGIGFLGRARPAAAVWLEGGSPSNVVGIYGGHADAANWPPEAVPHVAYACTGLDMCEAIPANLRRSTYGAPKASTTLDPVLYAGTDVMPGAFQEALWNIDFFRRTQEASGGIRSLLSTDQDGGTSGCALEPSWITREVIVLGYPDHLHTFCYAAGAAAISRWLAAYGFSSAASTWQTSAIAAWDFAEAIYSNTTTRNNYYAASKAIAIANDGWTSGTYDTVISNMQFYCDSINYRLLAAGYLYRLTGSSTYKAIVEALVVNMAYNSGMAGWQYCQTVGANPTFVTSYKDGAILTADQIVTASNRTPLAYRGAGRNDTGLNPSPTGIGDLDMILMRAVVIKKERHEDYAPYLKCMQETVNFFTGANQSGMSLTTGIGNRYTRCTLHDDSYFAGQQPPVGYTNYAYNVAPFGGGTLNFAQGFGINYIVELPEDSAALKRTMSYRKHIPVWEFIAENRYVIYAMEFTIEQHCWPFFNFISFVDRYDAVVVPPGYLRMRLWK